MTIVAGFKCKDGIVLCADTQETIEHTKIQTPKLRFEPRDEENYDGTDELMTVFAGAGQGPFIDKLIDRAWEDVQLATNFDEACDEAEKSIKLTYKEYGQIFQNGYCPYAELIYGIKMNGKSALFRADGAVVNEKKEYTAGGTGLYLSNFLCSRMYSRNFTIPQAIILASYVLFQAIEHLDGCGGEQHIAVLRNNGESEVIDPVTLGGIITQLKHLDKEAARILIAAVNLDLPEQKYEGLVEHFRLLLSSTRAQHKVEIQGWPEIKKAVVDRSKAKKRGVKPSTSQKSTGQQ